MKNTTSAEYLSKAVGNCFYAPMFLGSLILLVSSLSTGQLWMKLTAICLMIISPIGFWLSKKILWQFISFHGILSLLFALYALAVGIYLLLKDGFKEDLIGNALITVIFLCLSKVLFTASNKRKEFIQKFTA